MFTGRCPVRAYRWESLPGTCCILSSPTRLGAARRVGEGPVRDAADEATRQVGNRRRKNERTMRLLSITSGRQPSDWTTCSDEQVMTAVQRGDEAAFDELIRRKTAPLLQVVGRITGDREEARDIVQVVFLRAWERRRQFNPRWSPNTWLYRIGVNLAIDLVRSRRYRERNQRPLGAHLRAVHANQPRALADVGHREVDAILQQLVQDLTDRQRWVFLLTAVEGLASEEVATILRCRPSTVRNHLAAARRRLRQSLRQKFPEYAPPPAPVGADREPGP